MFGVITADTNIMYSISQICVLAILWVWIAILYIPVKKQTKYLQNEQIQMQKCLYAVGASTNDTKNQRWRDFGQGMVSMTSMVALTGFWLWKSRKRKISVFPEKFTLPYLVATVLFAALPKKQIANI